MRSVILGIGAGAVLLAIMPAPAFSESRDAYLTRLRSVCENGCLQPRQLLRTARKRGSGTQGELAGILDIRHVSRTGGKFYLHTSAPERLDRWDFPFEFGMSEYKQNAITNTGDIRVEIDKQTMMDLLHEPSATEVGAPAVEAGADIVVEGLGPRESRRPGLQELHARFFARRIIIRGRPRLETVMVGGKLDRHRRQLTLQLRDADDLVVLPRFDEDGRAVFDDREEGLRRYYQPSSD